MACGFAMAWHREALAGYALEVRAVEDRCRFYVPQQEVPHLLVKIKQGVTAAKEVGDDNRLSVSTVCPIVRHVTEYVEEKLGVLVVTDCCSSGTELRTGLEKLLSLITGVTGSPPSAGVQ